MSLNIGFTIWFSESSPWNFLFVPFWRAGILNVRSWKALNAILVVPGQAMGSHWEFFLIKSVDHINVVDKSFISIMGHGLEIGRGPPWREKNVWCKTSRGRAAGRFKRRSQQLGWRQNWDRRGRSSGWCYVLIDLASSIVPTDEMGHTRKADLSKAEFGELIEYPVRNVN